MEAVIFDIVKILLFVVLSSIAILSLLSLLHCIATILEWITKKIRG